MRALSCIYRAGICLKMNIWLRVFVLALPLVFLTGDGDRHPDLGPRNAPHGLLATSDTASYRSIFVSYAYSEGTRASAPVNLGFFLRHGVTVPANLGERGSSVKFGIVVNGDCSSSYCQSPTSYVQPAAFDSIRVWRRENKGFDFGAHHHVLQALGNLDESYSVYIFLNCGVVGPILPVYVPSAWHWTYAFADKLRGKVGLVGTSIVCLPRADLGGYGPSVEGFAFALSKEALTIAQTNGSSFRDHSNKVDAIINGEYALTDTINLTTVFRLILFC
jgi:hypothetical protein